MVAPNYQWHFRVPPSTTYYMLILPMLASSDNNDTLQTGNRKRFPVNMCMQVSPVPKLVNNHTVLMLTLKMTTDNGEADGALEMLLEDLIEWVQFTRWSF